LLATRGGRGLLARLHGARRAMFEELLTEWPERDRSAVAAALCRLAESLAGDAIGAAQPRRPGSPRALSAGAGNSE
ncbi:MAG: hypothetical protein ACRDVG_00095, partial [Jatrophihabitantaceae bacterium]